MGLEERYHFMVCIGGRYVCLPSAHIAELGAFDPNIIYT